MQFASILPETILKQNGQIRMILQSSLGPPTESWSPASALHCLMMGRMQVGIVKNYDEKSLKIFCLISA